MTVELKSNIPESRVYFSNHKASEERRYKGKKPTVKCSYCDNGGHTRDHCWILHPKLRPKHWRDSNKSFIRGAHNSSPKANHTMTSHSEEAQMFTSNPAMLINEFAAFLHKKQGGGENEGSTSHVDNKPAALLGQFAGFLAGKEGVTQQDIPGYHHQEDDW
ncbi:uncharacterized protein LOC125478816 [Pyrus x bretschneideri]|uniref:uncharacterized protein LOC125478816 n=1 Tax=Pyrus x bretschneideri TaxID=225117 RepID=UPI00202EE515|nr:uncharacterized protein LOC125478816 [Pyrus x bretschneideri]